MAQAYEYRPLTGMEGKPVRLLFLFAGAEDDQLTAELREVQLKADLDFIALSYTWDLPGTDTRLQIREDGCRSYLSIRPNVRSALTRLRESIVESNELPVWIDAICINQEDPDEKSQQVAMMGEIYSQASSVIVWLGDADEETELGLKAVEVLATSYLVMLDEKVEDGERSEDDETDDTATEDVTDITDTSESEGSQTESDNSMDLAGMMATRVVRNVIRTDRHPAAMVTRGTKRKRRVSTSESDDSGSVPWNTRPLKFGDENMVEQLSYLYPHHSLSLGEQLQNLNQKTILERLRLLIASDGSLQQLWEARIDGTPTIENLVLESIISHLKIVTGEDDHQMPDIEVFANAELGLPFAPSLCLAIATATDPSCSRYMHLDGITHVRYESLYAVALLHTLIGDFGIDRNPKRLEYLDLAAEDPHVRIMRSQIIIPDTPKLEDIVDSQLGVGFSNTLATLGPTGAIGPILSALSSLFDRPWFLRIWIQQEVVLAKAIRVMVGKYDVDWEQLVNADMFCFDNALFFGVGVGTCATLEAKRLSGNGPGEHVSDAHQYIYHASYARRAKATDARDKVYGWLGMLRGTATKSIVPDYHLTTAQVYQKFTEMMILEHRDLSILTLQCASNSTELPSWVLDLADPGRQKGNTPSMERFYTTFSAAGKSKVLARKCSDIPRAMLLQGKIVDKVVATSVAFNQSAASPEIGIVRLPTIGLIITAWASFARVRCTFTAGEHLTDVFWRTVIQDRKENGAKLTVEDRLAAVQTVIYVCKAGLSLPMDIDAAQLEDRLVDEINWRSRPETVLEYMSGYLMDLRMFATEAGRLGLGNYIGEPGDLVVLFSGGNMPFIVRGGNNAVYALVGPAYVHGIMNGESWGPRAGPLQEIAIQ